MDRQAIIYGRGRAQAVLQTAAGPVERLTFQVTNAGGLELRVTPLGHSEELGMPSHFKLGWTPRGTRISLVLAWDLSAPTVSRLSATTEAPDGSGGWLAPSKIENAEAVRRLLNSSFKYPCLVYPHADDPNLVFEAQPDPSTKYVLSDIKGLVHGKQSVTLVSRKAIQITRPGWRVTGGFGRRPFGDDFGG